MTSTVDGLRGGTEWIRDALDWRRVPQITDDSDGIIRRNEERLAKMAVVIRALMVPFLAIPLAVWHQLERPWLAVLALVACVAEATWFGRRAVRRGTLKDDGVLAWGDVLFCVALMTIGSRAATSELRNEVMTEVIPYSLVAALIVGFAFGLRLKSVLAVLVMWIAWFLALIPDITQKFGSDLLGFVLWFAVGLYVSTLMRSLAAHATLATAERRAVERELEAARHHEEVRRGLHDGVLSILDGLARDRRLEMTARRSAQLGAIQARNMLRASNTSGTAFEARLSEMAETFLGLQLLVRPRFYIHEEPPGQVADTVLAAANEALTNALKYAGDEVEVTFFAESGDGGLEISVLDQGVGFDMENGPRGGGLTTTFEAVKTIGGECVVTSAPGEGTQVVIRWPGTVDGG